MNRKMIDSRSGKHVRKVLKINKKKNEREVFLKPLLRIRDVYCVLQKTKTI